MNRFLLGALLVSAFAFPANAALKQGDSAPDFKAKASLAGKTFDFSLKSALKKGPVVVYFYPIAFTQGCNMEAHAFAESKDKFDAAKATIIGVSTDTIDRLNEFSADPQYCAGKFPVASDPDGTISKTYELKLNDLKTGMKDSREQEIDKKFYTERVTFVITPDSKIVATFPSAESGRVGMADHAEKALAIVEQLKAAKH